jgi:hypothetical protein
VTLDNDVIIERGRFADEKMQVAFVPR